MAKALRNTFKTLAIVTATWLATTTFAGAQDSNVEWTLEKTTAPAPLPIAPQSPDGLPDGHIAASEFGNIAQAWYTLPTTRYAHAILGDAIEAGGLSVRLTSGETVKLALPENEVFEDRTPRLVDLDIDGDTEIVTIVSDATRGAALAIYRVVAEGETRALKRIATTPFIGRSNRWRNIAGIADFDGDGNTQIAEVITPHIGGTLQFWTFTRDTLVPSGSIYGFSNHFIGSREQELSAVEDFDGDGVEDIAVPNALRSGLRIVGFSGPADGEKTAKEIAIIPLPSPVAQSLRLNVETVPPAVMLGLNDGSWWRAKTSAE